MGMALVSCQRDGEAQQDSSTAVLGISPLVRLWLLRILVPLGLHRKFILDKEFFDNDLAEAIGLGGQFELPGWDFSATELRAKLRKLHQEAERDKSAAQLPERLATNIGRLRTLLNLSDIDCRIVEFVVLQRREPLLEVAENLLGELSTRKVLQTLAVALGYSEFDIRASLEGKSALARSGLVSLDDDGAMPLRHKLDIISGGFADAMLSSDVDLVGLICDRVIACGSSQLELKDFSHISRSLDILCPYLKHAVGSGRKGVNIYIHGAPGTGKTELAKVIAKDLSSDLFEVTSEDGDGDPISGKRRLRALNAAQSFLAQSRVLIMFDEAEDVFNDGGALNGSTAQLRKAWVNRSLEENPVPMLWLSNSNSLDPAFIRRFDMVIELPVPPKQQRKQIVQAVCGDMINTDTAERIADAEKMSPAVIARAASVLRCIEGGMERNRVSSAIEHLVSNTLEAQGHRPLEWYSANRLSDNYDPAFIHADTDLAVLLQGLVRSKSARLCLYGPPGTGKTAFGRWLADQLGIPLLVKRCSDLMASYVGETEQNIARAFREAEHSKALLLIDEVDSFLQDRRGARHSWEVTAVNEMLTQMESFSGIFIASTNLMDNLDQAALRRFDLKVKFDYLKPEQAWQLLMRQCESMGIPAPSGEHRPALAQLAVLTPGDFAAVARQHRFRPIANASELTVALKQECALKEDGKRKPIGFRLAN